VPYTVRPMAPLDRAAAATRDEVLARAEALVPKLSERSAACEAARRAPAETVADLEAAGLLKICQPARYGGYELGWDVLCEVARILARGCGSQAWVGSIYNDHAQMLGMFERAAQDDVWAAEPKTRISASLDPVGKARTAEKGIVLSGHHRFSSGIDHAQWMIVGGHVDDGKAQTRSLFLVPKTDGKVVDDWYVAGLAGTGSNSFVVEGVFVPAHRIVTFADTAEGRGPGSLLPNAAPVFRMPRHDVAPSGFGSIAIGIAEAFLADYLAFTKARVSRGLAMAEFTGTQIEVGKAVAEIESAWGYLIGLVCEHMEDIAADRPQNLEQRLKIKLATSHACQSALGVVQRLFNSAGGRALFTDMPMQRRLRDLYAVAAHRSTHWELNAAAVGAQMLGAEMPKGAAR
jgi:3-hydroxy-9,10-secoandrosta-1,3,5(10)-triene-9,17-dione monooxygenase